MKAKTIEELRKKPDDLLKDKIENSTIKAPNNGTINIITVKTPI